MKKIIASLLLCFMPCVCMAINPDEKYDLTWVDIDHSWGVGDSFRDDYKFFIKHAIPFFVPERNVFNMSQNDFYRACISGKKDVLIKDGVKLTNANFKEADQQCLYVTYVSYQRFSNWDNTGYMPLGGQQDKYKTALMELNAEQDCKIDSFEQLPSVSYKYDESLSKIECDLQTDRCIVNRVFMEPVNEGKVLFVYCCNNNMDKSTIKSNYKYQMTFDRRGVFDDSDKRLHWIKDGKIGFDKFDENCNFTWGD